MSQSRAVIWRSHLLPGSETFVRNQGDALARWAPHYLGAVKVASPLARDSDAIAFPDDPRGRAELLRLKLTGRSARLDAALARLAPDLVHAHFGGDGWLVSGSTRRLGVPLVVTLHGQDVTRQPALPGARGARNRRHLRQAFDRAALVIAVSEFIRDRAIALGADPAKVRVHHIGVPIPPPPAATPKRWDVIFVGRFVAKKGVDDLVEAVGMLPAARRPRLLLVGSGPLEAPVRRRAAELDLDATFLGAQSPEVVRRHLAESRILAAPSRTAPDGDCEGLPTTILEAGSAGLPAVATYHSGIPEAVRHGETGLLSAERDRTALAAHLDTLLGDEALRSRLGTAARAHVETHFDLHRQTRLLEELYDEARSGRPAGATRIGS
ncbi:glycosyltransferase [Micromonospora sp. CB01531]|uniref:glycosyltransferase n=1 Tax=Micromonospora sp. CB01531 TaxID=1718947 RepID=UPI000939D94F|nr:glycosyltransferase [Micromonospora sp. CB01531]OKI53579.1 glycosyl transferase family 1 [Micromonospora sp. CB01531]